MEEEEGRRAGGERVLAPGRYVARNRSRIAETALWDPMSIKQQGCWLSWLPLFYGVTLTQPRSSCTIAPQRVRTSLSSSSPGRTLVGATQNHARRVGTLHDRLGGRRRVLTVAAPTGHRISSTSRPHLHVLVHHLWMFYHHLSPRSLSIGFLPPLSLLSSSPLPGVSVAVFAHNVYLSLSSLPTRTILHLPCVLLGDVPPLR